MASYIKNLLGAPRSVVADEEFSRPGNKIFRAVADDQGRGPGVLEESPDEVFGRITPAAKRGGEVARVVHRRTGGTRTESRHPR